MAFFKKENKKDTRHKFRIDETNHQALREKVEELESKLEAILKYLEVDLEKADYKVVKNKKSTIRKKSEIADLLRSITGESIPYAINHLYNFVEKQKSQVILDLVAEFNDYDHPLEFDAKYVQNYLLEKLNDK